MFRWMIVLLFVASPAYAEAPRVVATIKPLHSLVAQVMAGVGEPELLVQGAASPHTFQMKPSDARKLAGARVIFFIGPSYEVFLRKALKGLPLEVRKVAMQGQKGVLVLPVRHNESDEHDHDHGPVDGHMWLDASNGRIMLGVIAETLCGVDVADCERYRANAKRAGAQLLGLDAALKKEMAPFKERRFVVFHDAYQYFERAYGVRSAGSVALVPEMAPGAKHLAAIREKLRSGGAVCVFREPQFPPRAAEAVAEGTGARVGVLDPLGAGLENGPALYEALLMGVSRQLRECLQP